MALSLYLDGPATEIQIILVTSGSGPSFLNHKYNLTATLDGKTFIQSPHTFAFTRAVTVALQLLLVKSGLNTKPWCYSGNVSWALREKQGEVTGS